MEIEGRRWSLAAGKEDIEKGQAVGRGMEVVGRRDEVRLWRCGDRAWAVLLDPTTQMRLGDGLNYAPVSRNANPPWRPLWP